MTPEEQLRSELLTLALDKPETYYHADSQTHIFYAKWFRPFGVRGIGPFTTDAYDNYVKSVEDTLASAGLETLQFWKSCSEGISQ